LTRAFSDYSGSAASFCNANNNGNANNNTASSVGGCAPDSVRYHTVDCLQSRYPTQKEKMPCGFRPANIRLDTSGRTLLAWTPWLL
jgi:hypothetical protein